MIIIHCIKKNLINKTINLYYVKCRLCIIIISHIYILHHNAYNIYYDSNLDRYFRTLTVKVEIMAFV